MARVEKLSEADINGRLPEVPGWELTDGKLQRTSHLAILCRHLGSWPVWPC